MKRIVFAIPSYHRPDRQPLVLWLNRLGICRDDIVVTVQNDDDRASYQKWGSMCRIEGSKNGVGVSFNRNQCLRVEPGARLLMCDDGIRSINVMGADGKCEVIRTKERLLSMFDRMFSFCEASGVSVFSLNNSSSGLCASGFDFINHPFVSICMGVIDRRIQFDPKVRFLEDVERNLRIMRGGGGHTASPMRSRTYITARKAGNARCTETRAWTCFTSASSHENTLAASR